MDCVDVMVLIPVMYNYSSFAYPKKYHLCFVWMATFQLTC